MAQPHLESGGQASFPSRLEETRALLDWFEHSRPHGLDPMLWIQAQTALVEGFTNAVRHANAHLACPPPVEVAVEITPTHLKLKIRDGGSPFDISAALTGGENPSVEDGLPTLPDREAHWGLIMLSSLHRDFGWVIRYDPLPGGGNELLLKRLLS